MAYSLILLILSLAIAIALKHDFATSQDSRALIAPIGPPYGFLENGCFGFEVFDFNIDVANKRRKKNDKKSLDQSDLEILRSLEAGFLLKRFESESAFWKFTDEYRLMNNASKCVFEYFRNHEDDPVFKDDDSVYSKIGEIETASSEGIFLPIHFENSTWSTKSASVMYKFKKGEEGLYFLMFQICYKSFAAHHAVIRTSFEVDFHYKNKDKIGLDSYLTAGEMPLPIIFFYFFIGYLVCTVIWILNIKGIQRGHEGCFALPGERPIVYAIHHLMSILLILKTMTLLLEAIRYHYIRITGYAKFWSGMFYAISFVKSIFLFTVVLLIGSGWSFVKPFLSGKEKVIIFLVLLMQIINNIAIVVLASESEGENAYDDWSAILHILDILCCCAVLIPIVWQVRNLENSLSDDEDSKSMENVEKEEIAEKQKTLNKLKLFRSFYLIVVAYVYFTRVAVYLFATLLDYRHAWIRYLFIETATLAFYTIMGFQFRPMPENSYVVVKKRDDDELVFEREIELHYSRKH